MFIVVFLITLFPIVFILGTARLLTILPSFRTYQTARKRGDASHLLVVLGSGGHTAEMIVMLNGLDTASYRHRTYVVSEGDPVSAEKAVRLEKSLLEKATKQASKDKVSDKGVRATEELYGSYTLAVVPRARKIHQSLLTTPLSCLRTLLSAVWLLYCGPGAEYPNVPVAPDLIITNGPATSVIVIFASIFLRFFDFNGRNHNRTLILYVESFARIQSLSLSAKVVAWAVDRLLVQWEQLQGMAGGKAEYQGLLVLGAVDAMTSAQEDGAT